MSLNFYPDMVKRTAPITSVLIMGPKGAGKTYLIEAIAGSLKIPILNVDMEELLHGEPGTNSGCDLLATAFNEASSKCSCILHITNLEVLSAGNMSSTKWIERRLVKSLESKIADCENDPILVIGEYRYNPTQSIDSTLKDCFSTDIFISALHKKDRLLFLKKRTSNLLLEDINLEDVAKSTPSFLPADLLNLIKVVKKMARGRQHLKLRENCSPIEYITKCNDAAGKTYYLKICEEDFTSALKIVVPVLKQNGFPIVPEVTMADIGGMEQAKQQIYDTFIFDIENPVLAKAYSKKSNFSGILLWGPPGCGKTLFAKAVANQAGVNFLLISGAEVLKMYQGESERSVREAFALAKSVSPCIIYFDEFEGICPIRSSGSDSGSKGTIVTTLLTELNGVQSREGIYVMASTNRPDMIDPALFRPGRFDTKLYVGLPDSAAKKTIFMAETSNGTFPKVDESVNFDELSSKCDNFSGADCSHLIKTTILHAKKNYDPYGTKLIGTLYAHNFEAALEKVKPSVSAKALDEYEKLHKKYTNISRR